ncbi:MAG: ArsA-related P-loop ATPase, partial [Thermocrispum sp.]
MTSAPAGPSAADVAWTRELRRARLHFVTGKGGTGKTTLAAALGLALATGGRKVLLVEVEGRQGIAQLFDTEPLPYGEKHLVSAPDGGELCALTIDAEAALLEYFQMFYNLGFAGRTLRRMGAIEFATTLAPGLRDVLLTGKIKECVTRKNPQGSRVYDHVVVDSPPTGRVVRFLDVTRALTDVTRSGPIKSQADGVVKLLHSANTAVHVVTLLEEMPVRETLEAIDELNAEDLRPGAVLVNRVRPPRLPARSVTAAADGRVDASRVRAGLTSAGLELPD